MNDNSENPTFEQALLDLERIVHELEDGQVGLEESLARYEKGIALLKRCYAQLRQAEQKIMLLTGVTAADRPQARPFEHTASVDQVEKPVAPPPPRRAEPPADANRRPRVEKVENRVEKVENPPSLF